MPVAAFGRVPGCAEQASGSIAASAGRLFVYEAFGFKTDRRNRCAGEVPGGAWGEDPATGQATIHAAPDLHFSALISDRAGSALYGLSAEDANWERPAKLVRIDPRDGGVVQSRHLDPGFWRIAIAPLRLVPTGDVRASGPEGAR